MRDRATENRLLQVKYNQCVAIRDTLSDYLAQVEYVSSSNLRSVYLSTERRSNKIPRRSLLGAIFHRLVLEESDGFNLDMAEINDGCTNHRVSQPELQNIKGARDKLKQWSNKLFCDWIDMGSTETSIYWRDDSGHSWRARPDLIVGDLVIDLKTFSGKNQKSFLKNQSRNGFLIQAGHYLDGLKYLDDRPYRFGFLCIDLTAPFRIRFDVLDTSQIVLAKELLFQAKKTYFQKILSVSGSY